MASAVQKIILSPSRDIPFNKLVLSQSNVRRVKAGISIEQLAESIAQKSPVALQLIKEAVRASLRGTLDDGLKQETTLFGLAFSSEDKAEGVAAFLGKRPPEFKGR